jgi:tetratricopeptide (TPR) repeat protein
MLWQFSPSLVRAKGKTEPFTGHSNQNLDYEKFLSEGATLLHLHHFSEALSKFDQALSIKPKSAHALSLRARALKNLNRREEALADVRKAMACDPRSVQPYLSLAGFSMRDRDIARARQYLAQAEKIEPHNYEVAGLIAACLILEKKYKEALHYVNESLSKHPDAHRFAQRAALYRLLGDHKSELKDYDKAVSIDPKSAVYATERATTYWQSNRLREALKEINRALSLDPKYGQAYYIRANIEWSLKQTALVLSDMAKAISLEDNGTFYYFRGSIYEGEGEWKRAINDQLKADKLYPDQPYIKFALSRLYHRLLEPKAALSYINAAIKLEPKNAAHYEQRSQIYRTMMEYELSVADDTKAIEYSKELPLNSLINRIRYYRATKKFDLALKDQNRIISYFPPSKVELREARALIYVERGDYTHARDDYVKAKDDLDAIMLKHPTDANLSARAKVNLKLNRLKEALADCNQAIVKQPGMSSYYRLRADIHRAMGKIKDAQKDADAAKAADQASLPPR